MPAPQVVLNSKRDNRFDQLKIGDAFVINVPSFVTYIRVKTGKAHAITLGIPASEDEPEYWSKSDLDNYTVQRVKITDIVAEYE